MGNMRVLEASRMVHVLPAIRFCSLLRIRMLASLEVCIAGTGKSCWAYCFGCIGCGNDFDGEWGSGAFGLSGDILKDERTQDETDWRLGEGVRFLMNSLHS